MEQETTVVEKSKHIREPKSDRGTPHFKNGHLRFGGRRRNITTYVRELSQDLGIDVFELMFKLVKDGTLTSIVTEEGKRKRIELTATLEQRIDLMKHLSRFVAPMLTSTAITGPSGDEPVQVATLDIQKLMSDEANIPHIQALALALAVPDAQQIEAPATVVDATAVPTDPEDITDRAQATLKTDGTQHWRPR